MAALFNLVLFSEKQIFHHHKHSNLTYSALLWPWKSKQDNYNPIKSSPCPNIISNKIGFQSTHYFMRIHSFTKPMATGSTPKTLCPREAIAIHKLEVSFIHFSEWILLISCTQNNKTICPFSMQLSWEYVTGRMKFQGRVNLYQLKIHCTNTDLDNFWA